MFPVIEKVYEAKRKQIKGYPCHNIRASEAGHPCSKYLVHSVLDWERKQLHKVETQFIFDGGNLIEKLAIRQLEDAGLEITGQQRAFKLEEVNITGHIDLKLSNNGHRPISCEIKGLEPYSWESLNTIDDFHKSKKSWIAKYPAQLYLYMYAEDDTEGLFYIINKLTYKPKEIWVRMDHDYLSILLQKVEKINRHIKNRTYPDPVEDPEFCKWCSFMHICLPAKSYGDGVQVINDPVLIDALEVREANIEAKKGYEEADKYIKRICKGKEYVMAGNWIITGKSQTRSYKASEARSIDIWTTKIERI